MDEIVVHGGRPLHGVMPINGSKNAALPIMAAALLTTDTTVLHKSPRLRDVETMAQILRALGVSVDWAGPQTLKLGGAASGVTAPLDLVSQMRGSICVLGPLLATRGSAVLPLPGGCVLGKRPIDLHIKGLRALGAKIRVRKSCIYAHARRLRGARVNLAGPHGSTVLGTANVMMAAALAEGQTVIEEAACEPETQDLAHFLNACGARVSGAGTRTVTVDGVECLHGVEYSIIPDRIEAGTFLAAVAAAGGAVTLEGARPEHMRANIEVLERMGVEIRAHGDALVVARSETLKPVEFATAPYPGIPTDIHPQISVLLCLAEGSSTVHEGVYPRRFTYVSELNRMGARISHRGAIAAFQGVRALRGAAVHAPDLRTGAALVLAGLAAHGRTVITGVDQIDRGHQALEQRLRSVGADINRRQSEAAGYPARKSA